VIPSAPVHLASFDDAVHLADLAFGSQTSAVALVDGGDDRKLVMPLEGPMPPDGLLRLDEILLEAVPDDARLVYATRRDDGLATVREEELATWRQLVARHTGSPLVLCDWLVFVADDTVLSLAELAGPPAPWSG
jgi:hypothetical protein